MKYSLTEFLSSTFGRRNYNENIAANIVKVIFVCGWLVFAGIIVYNISLFVSIPLNWKIAIAAFIVLLPFSFFLQALLSVNETKTEKRYSIQNELRKAYTLFITKYPNIVMELNRKRNNILDDIKNNNKDVSQLYKQKVGLETKIEQKDREIQSIRKNRELYNPSTVQPLQQEIADMRNELSKVRTEFERVTVDRSLLINSLKNEEDNHLNTMTNFLIAEDKSLYSYFRQARETFDNIRREYLSWGLDEVSSIETIKTMVTNDATKNNEVKGKQNELTAGKSYSNKIFEFEIEDYLDGIINLEMKTMGLQFNSFLVPLSFFVFIYFTGFLIVLPLINSVFTGKIQDIFIPISDSWGIPLLAVQWGFLGGLVYTSITLLNRFLRKDIVPRVYFNAAFRLLFSAVVALIIYFFYMSFQRNDIPPQLLLLCFAAGVAPIQILIYYADSLISKINKDWRRRNTSGNRNISQLEGINSIIAQRLSEEGLDYIQQLSLCDIADLSMKTKFPYRIVYDWKNQAIFYNLTSDIIARPNSNEKNQKQIFLNEVIEKELGIRRISEIIEILEPLYTDESDDRKINMKMSFFSSINLMTDEKNLARNDTIFKHLFITGNKMLGGNLVTDITNPLIISTTISPNIVMPGQSKIIPRAFITDNVGITSAFIGVYLKGVIEETIDGSYSSLGIVKGNRKSGSWSGEYNFGADVPDGEYEVRFFAKDSAQNQASMGPISVTLARKPIRQQNL